MRHTHKLMLQISEDSASNQKLFWLEDVQALQFTSTAFLNENDGRIKVSTAKPNQLLSLGNVVAPQGLYVEVDANATLHFNSTLDNTGAIVGGIALPMKTNTGGIRAKFYGDVAFTSLVISADAALVNGIFCVWGDVAT